MFDGFDAVFQPAEVGIDIVGSERETDTPLLGPADDVEARNSVAGVDFQGDAVSLQDIQHAFHSLVRPIFVVVGGHVVGQVGRIGVDVGGFVGEYQDSLVDQVLL